MRLKLSKVTLILLGIGFLAISSSVGLLADQKRSVEDQQRRAQNLGALLESVEQVQQDLLARQKELEGSAGRGREEELRAEIRELSSKIESLLHTFTEVATGVELVGLGDAQRKEEEAFWSKELSELVSPLLNELKRLTSRPREIDRYRTELAAFAEEREVIRAGLESIEQLLATELEHHVRSGLVQLKKSWEGKRQAIETQIQVVQQKLERKLGEKKSWTQSVSDLSELFFESRVRNLLFALLGTLLFWFIVKKTHQVIQRVETYRRREQTFHARLFNVSYLFMSGMGSLVVFVLILFFMGDWVLLILCVMALLGIVWTSKHALPRFWAQATLLLNLGAVREGERVVVDGVPYKVLNINFYSHVNNPVLQNGTLRLPLRDLEGIRSRATVDSEPWFPTKLGDWVLLSDGGFGKVVNQTPQLVRLRLKGGSERVFTPSDFIAATPEVLASGFRHNLSFGVDYSHQEIATFAIPQMLEEAIRTGLRHAGYDGALEKLAVEFESAGASSLNIAILANFDGAVQAEYQELERLLQRLCVDACNEHGWIIPFSQLTVHMAGEGGSSLP